MKWFNKLLSIFLSLLFFGCASYRPVIDTKGVDMSAYEQDLAECQTYAREVKPGLQAVAGSAIGAGLGFAVSTAAGSRSDSGAATRVGAVVGAASGGAKGAGSQKDIIKNCLHGRGYNVLK